jgi:hypothetical protein
VDARACARVPSTFPRLPALTPLLRRRHSWTGYEGKLRVPYGSLIDEPALKPMASMFVGSNSLVRDPRRPASARRVPLVLNGGVPRAHASCAAGRSHAAGKTRTIRSAVRQSFASEHRRPVSVQRLEQSLVNWFVLSAVRRSRVQRHSALTATARMASPDRRRLQRVQAVRPGTGKQARCRCFACD